MRRCAVDMHTMFNVCDICVVSWANIVWFWWFWHNCYLEIRHLEIGQHTHTHTPVLWPFVRDYPGEPVRKRKNRSGFYWSKRQWVAMASAGPYASLHLAPDRYHTSSSPLSFFTGRMPFLPPNQQRQSTEGQQTSLFVVYFLPRLTTLCPSKNVHFLFCE